MPGLAVCVLISLASLIPCGEAQDLLPDRLEAPAKASPGDRGWAIDDIVEVTRISGIAVQKDMVAFILKQPSLAKGEDRYGVYAMPVDGSRPARKLVDAAFISDLQAQPGSAEWTFRGDIGAGVQLYRIGETGTPRPLVVNSRLGRVGGSDGLVVSCCEAPRATGILDYQWAPDGSALWYSALRIRTTEEARAHAEAGVVFDDQTMISPIDMWAEPASPAVELHLFDPATGADRIVAMAPGDRVSAQFAFRREGGDVAWLDGRRIAYRLEAYDAQGRRSLSHWVVGVDGTAAKALAEAEFPQSVGDIPVGEGVLALDGDGTARRLVTRGSDGTILKDHGPVSFTHMGGGRGYWRDPQSGRTILGVRYPDHDGLVLFPATPAGTRLARIGDSLSDCAFAADFKLGVCNRESLERAPELVVVDPATAEVRVLVRPNARYDRIAALMTVRARWTSRLGSENDGYITYPRGYRAGRKYPTLIVTHAGDARNRFADPVFQWQYPVQLFAERGYLVLSVNEARKDRAASAAYGAGKSDVPVAKMQAEWGVKPVASMEAAALALIEQGAADPDRIGIAGYSRGASVTTFALSQSKLFRAGASGDADWFSAGSYWDSAVARGIYDGLFGGSPLDPRYIENYLALSPSARAGHFGGPLLQQFTAATAAGAVELDAALKVANVPAELIFYPGETHVFHKPRHRASAMRLSFDWFDYWLQGERDPDEGKAAQYRRWDNMAAGWRSSRAVGQAGTPQ